MNKNITMRLPKFWSKSKGRTASEPAATPQGSPGPERSHAWQSRNAIQDWTAATFSGRTVTVSVDEDAIRVAVIKDGQVLSWGTIDAQPLEAFGPDSANDPNGERQAWSPQQLGELLGDLPQTGGRAVVALPHRSSVPRRIQIPDVKRKYRGPLIVSEISESVPFKAEDVDIAWHDRPATATDVPPLLDTVDTQGRRDVFAEASVISAVDSEVARFRSGGLRPRAGYSRATALASAVGLDSCLIVDMGETSASVVLVDNGIPEVVHQIEFAGGSSGHVSPESIVATAVERVSAYGNAGPGGGSGGQDAPAIVLTGMVDDDPALLQRVEASAGRRVEAFNPGFNYPGHFPANEYAVNLGLAAADAARARRGKRSVGVPRLSLLSERHLPPAFPAVKVAAVAALAALAFGAYMFTGLVGSTETTVATLSAQEADLGSRARVHRLELASVTAAKRQAEDAATLAAAVDLAVADFDREAAKLVNRATRTLDAAGDAGVALSSLVKEGDSFKLVGSAATFDAPSEFAESLVRTGLFASANVLSVEKGGESVSFNMVAAFVSDVPKAGPLGEASSPAAVR